MKTTYSRDYLQNSTPSRKDGVDAVKEQQLRSTYFSFIKRLIQELKLPGWTLETATIFTHRFFAARSISKNDRFLIAAASVFLACKVDESPRGLRDVAYVFIKIKSANKPAELEKLRSNTDAATQPVMENILLAERAVLYTLAFDLNVDHAYSHVINTLKKLRLTEVLTSHATADPEVRKFFQATVNMLNDSLKTSLCLQYEASKLAAATMFHVAKLAKYNIPIPHGTSFFKFFDISQTEVDDIVRQLMQLYDEKPKAAAVAAAPQLSDLLQSTRANGPPLPTFRPVILTDSPGGPQQQPLANGSASERGELAAGSKPTAAERPAADALTVSTTTALAGRSACDQRAEAGSPHAEDSDAEHDVGHAPGSGDQNNHNEPEAQQRQQLLAMARKRTRSPEGLEEGELGCLQPNLKRSPGLPCA